MSSSKSLSASRVSMPSTFFIATSRYFFAYPERQHFPEQKRLSQARRSQCFQSRQKRTPLYSDWHSLLRQSWSLEGWALRCQIRYLVPWVRLIRNDNPWTPLSSLRHGGSDEGGHSRHVPSHKWQIFEGSCSSHQNDVAAKSQDEALIWKAVHIELGPEKDRGTSHWIPERRRQRKILTAEDYPDPQEVALPDRQVAQTKLRQCLRPGPFPAVQSPNGKELQRKSAQAEQNVTTRIVCEAPRQKTEKRREQRADGRGEVKNNRGCEKPGKTAEKFR